MAASTETKRPYLSKWEFMRCMQVNNLLVDGQTREAKEVIVDSLEAAFNDRIKERLVKGLEYHTPVFFNDSGEMKLSRRKMAEVEKSVKAYRENNPKKEVNRKWSNYKNRNETGRTKRAVSKTTKAVVPKDKTEDTAIGESQTDVLAQCLAEIKELKKERKVLKTKITKMEKKLAGK